MPRSHKTIIAAPDFNELAIPFPESYPCDTTGLCPFKSIEEDITDIDITFCIEHCRLQIKGAAAIGGNYDEIR